MINENKDVYTIKLPLLVFSKAKKNKKIKKEERQKDMKFSKNEVQKSSYNSSHLQWKKTINAPGLKDEEMAFSVLFHRISVTSEPG